MFLAACVSKFQKLEACGLHFNLHSYHSQGLILIRLDSESWDWATDNRCMKSHFCVPKKNHYKWITFLGVSWLSVSTLVLFLCLFFRIRPFRNGLRFENLRTNLGGFVNFILFIKLQLLIEPIKEVLLLLKLEESFLFFVYYWILYIPDAVWQVFIYKCCSSVSFYVLLLSMK